jgi:phospholipase/carboxylesterase
VRTHERLLDIAGLTTTVIDAEEASTAVVLLHGYSMQPSDLTPFAHSIGVPARFFFPRGPFSSPAGGYAWWAVDEEARAATLLSGPRDLADQRPTGLDTARRNFAMFLAAVVRQFAPKRVIVGGFSQGGMLACDFVLRGTTPVDGLILLSSSRLAFDAWQPCHERLRELPAYCSHGEKDSDLAFAAGLALRDFLEASGARVSWMPFEGGHEIPLVVWRGLRKFLAALLR